MIAVDYFDNLAEAQADPALARALGRATQMAPFDRLEWWSALAELCLPGERPLLAVARDGGDLAALPLMRPSGGRHLRSLANWYSFRAGPVFSGGTRRPELLAALAGRLRQTTHRVSLAPLLTDDASLLETVCRQAGWLARRERHGVNHVLAIGGRSFADYWAARPGRLRETVRRKRGKSGLEIRIAARFDPADWADYQAVYATSWKGEEGSMAFLRRFAEAEGAAGTLRLGIAAARGRPVAAQLWTVEGGTAWIHKLAYDQAAGALSPGTLLGAAMFQHAIDEDKVACIDFGTGDDGYKRDWMEEARPLVRLDLLDPSQPRAWPHLAHRGLRALGLSPARGVARPRGKRAAEIAS